MINFTLLCDDYSAVLILVSNSFPTLGLPCNVFLSKLFIIIIEWVGNKLMVIWGGWH